MDPEAKTVIEVSTPLPEGWENAVSPVDGRNYYYNSKTGATSWTHPAIDGVTPAPSKDEIENVPSIGDYSGIMATRTVEDYGASLSNKSTLTKSADAAEKDIEEGGAYTKMTEYDPKAPINAHRCYSIVAMILFFPLGVIAFCKSLTTVSRYHQERYEAAHNSSQAALLFSRISCIIGVIFWSYFAYCYFAGPAAPFVVDIPDDWWPEIHIREYFDNKA